MIQIQNSQTRALMNWNRGIERKKKKLSTRRKNSKIVCMRMNDNMRVDKR